MRILMVSTEFPPMLGGVGRYTANLTKELRKLGLEVYIVCNENGNGEFSGLSPTNEQNSQLLLKLADELKPDVVHIQFEPGMYGLLIDPMNPRNSGTYIDSFYRKCKTPITTTFHSGYSLGQWMSIASMIKKSGRIGRLGIPLRFLIRFWKYFLNYKAFVILNKEKLLLSKAGIVFSHYMSNLVGGGDVIYHGAEPAISPRPLKRETRSFFGLPTDKRLAVALGFRTATKGWDIIRQMDVPREWNVVLNSSKNHYNNERIDTNWIQAKKNIIDLKRGFISEEELSMLLYAADAVLLPYSVTAASGVMFDALAHGIPFIATDLGFFKEFSAQGLGVTVKRKADAFSTGLKTLDKRYSSYTGFIDAFKQKLKWNIVARKHLSVYYYAAEGNNPMVTY